VKKPNTKQRFEKAAKSLKTSVVRLLGTVSKKRGSLRSSIHDLGKALSQLQTLAKKYNQSFSAVVENAPINLPSRTAYHYIVCYEKAGKLSNRVFALVENAGYDPAQPRILSKLNRMGNRVSKMTPAALAAKLEKGANSKKVTPLERVRRSVRRAVKELLAYARKNEIPYSDARSEAISLVESILSRLNHLKKAA